MEINVGIQHEKNFKSYSAAKIKDIAATIRAKDHKIFVWKPEDQNHCGLMSQNQEKGNNVSFLITKWEIHE